MPFTNIITNSKFDIDLPHDYTTQPMPSNKLMILLPGKGYIAESPLMRYMGQIGYQNGYDTLHIRYAIHRIQVDDWFSRFHDIHADTQDGVLQVMSNKYDTVCVVAKSLGTVIAVQLLAQLTAQNISALMLTPIQDAMEMIGDVRALGIIGTADPAYEPDMIQTSATRSWQVYDDLNHSLEYKAEWAKSVKILPDILHHCEAFIRGDEN